MTFDIFGIVQYLHRNYLPENYRIITENVKNFYRIKMSR